MAPIFSKLTGFALLVQSIAILSASDAGHLEEGARAWTADQRDEWALAKNAPAGTTADGITVVAATGAGASAFWMRQIRPDAFWGWQTTWYVDPTSGSDNNSGAGSGTALKTVAEFGRRLVHSRGGTLYTVNVLSDVPDSDVYVDRRQQIAGNPSAVIAGSSVLFTGQRTVVASGTTAAGTTQTAPASAAATAQAQLQDATMDFTPHIGRMVVAANGDTAHILTDKGGGVGVACRVTDWITSALALSATGPGNNAAYSIVTLTKWRAQIQLSVSNPAAIGSGQNFCVVLQNLELDDLGRTARALTGTGFVAIKTCKLSNTNGGSTNLSLEPPGSWVSIFCQATLMWNNNNDVRFANLVGGGNGNFVRCFISAGCGMRRYKYDVETSLLSISGLCIQAGWISGSTTYTARPEYGSITISSGSGSWLGVYNDFDLPGSSAIIGAVYVGQGVTCTQIGSFYGVGSPNDAVSGITSANGGRVHIRTTINTPAGGATNTTAYNYVPGAGGGSEMSLDGLAATVRPITSAAAGAVLPAAGDPRTFANYIALFNRNMTNYETLGGFYAVG